ncbi:MAG: zf-TFIIB domain-containing protein [Fimbriimonas sp.]
MARACPDCNLPLDAKTFNGVTVDVCARCAGIFFDEGEVNRLRLEGNDHLTEVEDALRPAEDYTADFQTMKERPRSCPNCKRSMDKVRYLYNSTVMIDTCPGCCGVWVEDGELQRMREVLDSNQRGVGKKVRTETHVANGQATPKAEDNAQRVNRLERALSIFSRKSR